LKFTLVNDCNSKEAYQVLVDRTIQLIDNGFKQYIKPFPVYEIYHKRTLHNENWALTDDGNICGIVSIIKNGIGEEWQDIYSAKNHFWISSLFVSIKYKHQNIGKVLIESCVEIAKSQHVNELLIDCYIDSHFLEKYYTQYGFTTIGSKLFEFPGRQFNAALMQMKI